MSDGNIQATEVLKLVDKLGIGAHCIGGRVLYVRVIDPRWSVTTRVMVQHMIQDAIDYGFTQMAKAIDLERPAIASEVRANLKMENAEKVRLCVRSAVHAAIKKERQRVRKDYVLIRLKGKNAKRTVRDQK